MLCFETEEILVMLELKTRTSVVKYKTFEKLRLNFQNVLYLGTGSIIYVY
jgi:hypothetical protein